MPADSRDSYRQVDPDAVEDLHEGTDIPGEFRPLTEALGARQLAATLVRVPQVPRTHRNEGDEMVEMWAVSPWMETSDSTKLPDFWDPSPNAKRRTR